MKRTKKLKPIYLRVRMPSIGKIGGAHNPAKGGKYRRGKVKESTRREIKAELE